VGAGDVTPVHRFIHVDGGRLHLLDHGGSGRLVLLVHGVLGNAWMWHDVAPALAGTGRVVALDLRGYGDSQWSPTGAYSTDSHAADVAAVVEQLDGGAVNVVGFSWGGLVGLALAARRPELVARLAMVDVPPSFAQAETDVPPLAGDYAGHAEAVEGERRLSPRAAEPMLDVMAAYGTRPVAGGRLARKHDPCFLERWPFRRDDRWDELRALAVPLLVVRAGESVVLSEDEAARMREQASNAELVSIPDCGHLVPVERPEPLASALRAFLGQAT
jgi:pimeloyl-ACP methyl ester carboxylesterase